MICSAGCKASIDRDHTMFEHGRRSGTVLLRLASSSSEMYWSLRRD